MVAPYLPAMAGFETEIAAETGQRKVFNAAARSTFAASGGASSVDSGDQAMKISIRYAGRVVKIRQARNGRKSFSMSR